MVIEPGNNVNSSNNSTGKARQSQPRSSESAKSSNSSKGGNSAADNVSLSTTAQSLSKLEAAIAAVPEVDAERVAEIKAYVESGQYKVDTGRLAAKMLGQDDF